MIETPSPLVKFFDIVELDDISKVGVLNGKVIGDHWRVIQAQNGVAILVNPKGCIKTPVLNIRVIASYDPSQVLQDAYGESYRNPKAD